MSSISSNRDAFAEEGSIQDNQQQSHRRAPDFLDWLCRSLGSINGRSSFDWVVLPEAALGSHTYWAQVWASGAAMSDWSSGQDFIVAKGGAPVWAIPWPCIHEFVAVITHPRIYRPPTSLIDAIRQVEYWKESPTLRLIGEEPGYWEHIRLLLIAGKAIGPLVHNARVAAICRTHGVTELWTADRDYSRFDGLRTRNPMLPRP